MRSAPLAIANSFKTISLAFICLIEIVGPYMPDDLARYLYGTLLPINERYPILLILFAVLCVCFIAASLREVRYYLRLSLNCVLTLTAIAAPIVVLSRFIPLPAAIATTTVFYLATGLVVGLMSPKRSDRLA